MADRSVTFRNRLPATAMPGKNALLASLRCSAFADGDGLLAVDVEVGGAPRVDSGSEAAWAMDGEVEGERWGRFVAVVV